MSYFEKEQFLKQRHINNKAQEYNGTGEDPDKGLIEDRKRGKDAPRPGTVC